MEPNPQLDWAKKDVSRALRQLSANLMRIGRGAGQPRALITHATALLDALENHRVRAGRYPTNDEIRTALKVTSDIDPSASDALWTESENNLIKGALAITADRQLHRWSKTVQGTVGLEQLSKDAEDRERLRKERAK